MSASRLDQIVKGAPPSGSTTTTTTTSTASRRPPSPGPARSVSNLDGTPPVLDPGLSSPSSPPQIYLNLLILEASLRAQYVTLQARRRQHSFFLFLLGLWIAYFGWALFLRPREDGRGVGGSVYWVVERAEKLALMGGVVTAILVWGTGQWERGIRWPRRWFGVANRGLRNINAKLVIIRGPWWRELLSTLGFLVPYASLFPSAGSSYHYVDHLTETGSMGKRSGHGARASRDGGGGPEDLARVEEDLSPGGDLVKLLLLPKPFSPVFRENWELYRLEYWEKENERRADLRRQLRRRQRELAKRQGGWLWWTGWRGWNGVRRSRAKADPERAGHAPHHHHHHHLHAAEKDSRRRNKGSSRSGSQSRTSSRSSTPTHEMDERHLTERMRRRSSNAGSTGGRPRKIRSTLSTSDARSSRLLAAPGRPSSAGRGSSRPGLPRASSSVGRESDESASSPGVDASAVQDD